MIMDKELTPQQVFQKLATLCARGEHCQHEMLEKMRKWGVDEPTQAQVMQRLVTERYVDDARYAAAFVRDKVHYNHWGRRKVEQALWQKHIDDDIRQRVLDDISDEEYLNILRPLLKQKRRTTKAASDYELDQKLIRFAVGRGFTFDIIRQCIDVDEENYEPY